MKCLNCGTEMENVVDSFWACPKCFSKLDSGAYYISTQENRNIGWICPKCGRSLAPWVNECPCSEVTTAWGTEKPFNL